jgi:hypothetical protein
MWRELLISGSTLYFDILKSEVEIAVLAGIAALCLNSSTGRKVLYPINLFATWAHEMAHGMAAILMGGSFIRMVVNRNGSGVASYRLPGGGKMRGRRSIIFSAGYLGTAFLGAFLLAVRHLVDPTLALMVLGASMVASVVLFVRNGFGAIATLMMAAALIGSAHFMDSDVTYVLYAFLAVALSLNALRDIKVLFSGRLQPPAGVIYASDAHAMRSIVGGPPWFWAGLWMLLSVVMLLVGLALGAKGS